MKQLYISLLLTSILFSCGNKKNDKVELKPTVENIDSLLTIYPDSIPLLLFRGEHAAKKYDFYAALNDGARAYRLDSMNTKVRMLYATALNNKANRTIEEVIMAQNHYHFVISKEPKNTDALVELAASYRYLRDVDNAFKYVNQALKIDNKKREAYALKGSIYMDLEKFDLAKSSYETAVQQDPNYYEAYLHLAILYHKENNPICLEYYQTAYELNPNDPEFLYSLAFAQEYFGKIEESKTSYRKLTRNSEKYYQARGNFHLGHIKQRLENDVDSAIFFYSAAIDKQYNYVEAYHNRGMCYELKGFIQDARQEYLTALKYDENFMLSMEAYQKLAK